MKFKDYDNIEEIYVGNSQFELEELEEEEKREIFDRLKKSLVDICDKKNTQIKINCQSNTLRLYLTMLFQAFSLYLKIIYLRISNWKKMFHVICISSVKGKGKFYEWNKNGNTHHIVFRRWEKSGKWTYIKNDKRLVYQEHGPIFGEDIWWGNFQLNEKEIISSLKFFGYYSKETGRNKKLNEMRQRNSGKPVSKKRKLSSSGVLFISEEKKENEDLKKKISILLNFIKTLGNSNFEKAKLLIKEN